MYQSFIGLEVHIHLLTESKVFCSCKTAFGDEPNTNVCPVCMGLPGVLPVLNGEAMRMGAVVAKALNCTVSPRTWFERKQYFYPDMPKNYQISQFASPLGIGGYVDIEFHRLRKRIRIKECHLEEDAGKMIHAGNVSLLDYNRAGYPLLEIVTEPDFEIGEEAEIFLQQLRRTVRYLGVCDGNMEEGSLRCDANVSVNLRGKGLGRKVEIKNLNSSRFVKLGLNYEIKRQTEILEKGGSVRQETRLWNENRDQTEPMRTKESAQDYRYFPEPDLPPFEPDAAFLSSVDASLVELPFDRERRVMERYGLSEGQAAFVCEEKQLADYFESSVAAALALRSGDAAQELALAERVSAWLSSDVKRIMNRESIPSSSAMSMRLTPPRLASLVVMIADGRISGKIAKQVLEAVFSEDSDPEAIVSERGWEQITDPVVVSKAVDGVFVAEAGAVDAARSGDAKIMAYLVGKVLAATDGRAEPALARRLVEDRLGSGAPAESVVAAPSAVEGAELSGSGAAGTAKKVDIISFGGAISGRKDGDVVLPGVLRDVRKALSEDTEIGSATKMEFESLGAFLSEEVSPTEWATLVRAIGQRLTQGTASEPASGVVVAHGTDTLSYGAALAHWLFGRSSIPVSFVASSEAPGSAKRAASLLRGAVLRSIGTASGVAAFVDGKQYDAANLRFDKLGKKAFSTWNAEALAKGARLPRPFDALSVLPDLSDEAILSRLEAATKSLMILKIYPGMRSELFQPLVTAGCSNFILELYDTGTAPGGSSPYSLRDAVRSGRERGAAFYCTSQQEGVVDFSRYPTAHELWKEGAVPMGALSTESAYARFVAAWLIAGDEEGARALMEDDNARTH